MLVKPFALSPVPFKATVHDETGPRVNGFTWRTFWDYWAVGMHCFGLRILSCYGMRLYIPCLNQVWHVNTYAYALFASHFLHTKSCLASQGFFSLILQPSTFYFVISLQGWAITPSHRSFKCRLYSVSHSLPNPAGWRTAAPCRNN